MLCKGSVDDIRVENSGGNIFSKNSGLRGGDLPALTNRIERKAGKFGICLQKPHIGNDGPKPGPRRGPHRPKKARELHRSPLNHACEEVEPRLSHEKGGQREAIVVDDLPGRDVVGIVCPRHCTIDLHDRSVDTLGLGDVQVRP